jgi:hypothetical protein
MKRIHLTTCCADWAKSSYSGSGGGNCVEWAPAHVARHGAVPIRDSKDLGRPPLFLPAQGWTRFIAAVKADAFGL